MLQIKLTDISNTKTFDLVRGEFKMRSNVTKLKSERDYSQIASEDYIHTEEKNVFIPQKLKLSGMVKYTSEFKEFTRFLLFNGQEFILEISKEKTPVPLNIRSTLNTQDNKTYRVFVKLLNHSRLNEYSSDLVSFEFEVLTLSRYIYYHNYVHIAPTTPIPGLPYDYTYNYTYERARGGYAESSLIVRNDGDTYAKLLINFEGLAENPRVSVNNTYTTPGQLNALGIDNYSINVPPTTGQSISFSSFSKELYLRAQNTPTSEPFTIEQYRDKSKLTWIKLSKSGENTLYFNNVTKALVTVIEEYNDLPI